MPHDDFTVYIVVSFHRNGLHVADRDWHDMTSLDETIHDIAAGQLEHVDRVLAFNTAEGWSRDVSEDIALEIVRQAPFPQDISGGVRDFIEHICGVGTVIPALPFQTMRYGA